MTCTKCRCFEAGKVSLQTRLRIKGLGTPDQSPRKATGAQTCLISACQSEEMSIHHRIVSTLYDHGLAWSSRCIYHLVWYDLHTLEQD